MQSLRTWTPRERLLGAVAALSMALSILAVSGLAGGVSEAQPQRLIRRAKCQGGDHLGEDPQQHDSLATSRTGECGP